METSVRTKMLRRATLEDNKIFVEEPLPKTLSEYFLTPHLRKWQTQKKRLSIRSQLRSEKESSRETFNFVRNLAIKKLETDIINIMKIRFNLLDDTCQKSPILNEPFSWLLENFRNRRKLDNTIWVDLICLGVTPTCMEIEKFRYDMLELIKLLPKFFHLFYIQLPPQYSQYSPTSPVSKNILKSDMGTLSEDMVYLLNILPNLERELKANFDDFHYYISALSSLGSGTQDSTRQKIKLDLEQQLMNVDVFGSIESRYQMFLCQETVRLREYVTKKTEINYDNEIKSYLLRIEAEKTSIQYSLSVYYALIHVYKTEFDHLASKYEQDLEHYNNDNHFQSMRILKLSEERFLLEREILRFRKEIAAVREIEKKEFQKRVEQRMREEEERAARELQKAEEQRKKDIKAMKKMMKKK